MFTFALFCVIILYMEITARIPKDKDEGCSLYVSGHIRSIFTIPYRGRYLWFTGCAVLFYTFSRYRRAYVIAPDDGKCDDLPLLYGNLPFLSKPVYILGIAEGRKVDLLKFMCFNIEKIKGKEVYLWNPCFWLRLCAALDRPSKRRKGRTKRLAMSLIKRWENRYG